MYKLIDRQPRGMHCYLIANYLAWAIYFVLYNIYSIFWREYATANDYDYISTLIWFAKEWGIWLLLSPIVLYFLDAQKQKRNLWVLAVSIGFVSLLTALSIRSWLNMGEYPTGGLPTIVIMLPKYLPAYLMLFFAWLYLSRRKPDDGSETELPKAVTPLSAKLDEPMADQIEVEHAGLALMISVNQIYSVKAAGNYVEIACAESSYLKRATLKQLLTMLPQGNFVQVHRSHVINLDKFVKLSNTENGGGIVTLANQCAIPVSKRGKTELKSHSLVRRAKVTY